MTTGVNRDTLLVIGTLTSQPLMGLRSKYNYRP
jgi:hypothetical protein